MCEKEKRVMLQKLMKSLSQESEQVDRKTNIILSENGKEQDLSDIFQDEENKSDKLNYFEN